MRVADTIAALCVALLGATTVGLARQLPYEAEYGPGPGFLPLWIGAMLVVLSGFLFIEARKEDLRVDSPPDGEGDSRSAFLDFAPGAFGPWAIFCVSTIAVSFLFERLGFALSVGLFMLVTMRWVARQSWLATILLALLTPVALYLGFVRVLMVPLPLTPDWF